MLILFTLAYFSIILFACYSIVRHPSGRKVKKAAFITQEKVATCAIILITYIVFYILSLILNMEAINPIIFRKDVISISFIGVLLQTFTSICLSFLYTKYRASSQKH